MKRWVLIFKDKDTAKIYSYYWTYNAAHDVALDLTEDGFDCRVIRRKFARNYLSNWL